VIIKVKLKELHSSMLSMGYDRKTLANKSGLSYITINTVINNTSPIRIKTANKIAAALEIKTSDLFDVE